MEQDSVVCDKHQERNFAYVITDIMGAKKKVQIYHVALLARVALACVGAAAASPYLETAHLASK